MVKGIDELVKEQLNKVLNSKPLDLKMIDDAVGYVENKKWSLDHFLKMVVFAERSSDFFPITDGRLCQTTIYNCIAF